MSSCVFLYGTLLNRDLLAVVLGREFEARDAVLHGYAATWVEGEEFPMISVSEGAATTGICLENLSTTDIARLDFYEGPYSYGLSPVTLTDGTRALTYLPDAGLWQPAAPWSVDDWTTRHGALQMIAAEEIMDRFDTHSVQEVARRTPVIMARAQAKLNAVTSPSPRELRVKNDVQDIVIKEKRIDHDNWFMAEDLVLTHPRYDGGTSADLTRGVFVMADAVTVLPYDPVRDVVMLIEQFRVGIYRRGDPHPWSLEVIAGRVDGGETVEQAAHREAREEAGLELKALHKVSSYYPSPGAATEYLTSYIATAELPDSMAGLGGLASENEDIRTMIVPFKTLMAAVTSGEAENAPLIISALGLARMRDGMRTDG